jgi:hypothetical protein
MGLLQDNAAVIGPHATFGWDADIEAINVQNLYRTRGMSDAPQLWRKRRWFSPDKMVLSCPADIL